jgi:serine protease AprX
MTNSPRVSPVLEQALADGKPNEKHEAIVIFRVPRETDGSNVRGRLRTLKARLATIEARASTQSPMQGKILQDYRENASGKAGGQVLAAAQIGSSTLPVASVEVTRNTLDDLLRRPEVMAIIPNQKIHLIKPKQVDYERLNAQEAKKGLTWGLEHLKIPELWQTTKGKGINVAVLDSGVYADHPALAGRLKNFVLIDPLGRRIEAKPAFDSGAHGTHVCGTIAGNGVSGVSIGVAPESKLLVGAVLFGEATLATIIEGMAWAVEEGADIINMSFGMAYYEPLFEEVLRSLIQTYGVLPVVAIGNENHGNTSSPGNIASAFGVGALEKMPGRGGKVQVAAFSSGASLSFPGAPESLVHKPDVTAPGAQVLSCVPPENGRPGPGYVYMDGTSMATPHVAGVAALLMAAKPTVPVTEIVQALKDTAKHPLGMDQRPDNRWGYGEIRPLDALKVL